MLKGFRISGNTVFTQSELLVLVQDYVGKETGFAELDTAVVRISRHYRERGYMVARAYLPAQEIRDGVVEIAVIEGRFGGIELRNHSRVRDAVLRTYMDGLPGAVVTEPNLERRLLLLNDLAGVGEARANLRSGANVGESDLVVDLSEGRFAAGSIELDNHGNRFTGANRLTGRLALLSPLGMGDALNGTFTEGFNGLQYGRLSYQMPLGGNGLRLGGVYSHANYRLGGTFAALDASGTSDSYALSMSYPFIRSRNFNLYGQAAYDWRKFEDRVGSTPTVTDKSTRGATLTLNGDSRDALIGGGVTVFSLAYNAGRVNIETPAARATDDATARTGGHFDKWTMNLLRQQSLGERLSVYLSLSAQRAGKNLDSSEKFVLGGVNGVRAYPQGEASGDSGYVATVEARYVPDFAAIPGVLQPFVFVDAGGVTISQNPFAVTSNKRRLAGGGIGLL